MRASLSVQNTQARKDGDYDTGDQIRHELQRQGILLMDVQGGTTWRPAPVLDRGYQNG